MRLKKQTAFESERGRKRPHRAQAAREEPLPIESRPGDGGNGRSRSVGGRFRPRSDSKTVAHIWKLL